MNPSVSPENLQLYQNIYLLEENNSKYSFPREYLLKYLIHEPHVFWGWLSIGCRKTLCVYIIKTISLLPHGLSSIHGKYFVSFTKVEKAHTMVSYTKVHVIFEKFYNEFIDTHHIYIHNCNV